MPDHISALFCMVMSAFVNVCDVTLWKYAILNSLQKNWGCFFIIRNQISAQLERINLAKFGQHWRIFLA